MGRIKNGILGGFSGKVGTVVGYKLYNEAYMRSLPKEKSYTGAEHLNQAKFKMVQARLEPLKDLIKVGFNKYYTKTGGYRGAIAYTRKVAMVEDDAGFYIDPALFKISGGDLPVAINPTVTLESPEQMRFDWDISNLDKTTRFDQLMLLVYDVADLQAETRIFNGTFRKEGTLTIEIPTKFKGKAVDVYIGFVAADRSIQSDSQYLGRVAIPA